MAIENKRVIDLANESTSLAGDEYVLLDSDNTGTTKYRLSRLSDEIDVGVGALGAEITNLKDDLSDLESDGVVASAEQLLSDKYTVDQVPYHYRASGGNGADREFDDIVGGSVVWNQLCSNKAYTNTYADTRDFLSLRFVSGANFSTIGNANTAGAINVIVAPNYTAIVMLKHSGGSQDFKLATNIPFVAGHKYFAHIDVLSANPSVVGGASTDNQMVHDLTAMFGTTIADYIYSLEQSSAGAGVAFFKKLFPNDYYEYNAGEMMHVSGISEHEMVGFNQWDEEWKVGHINSSGTEISDSTYRLISKNFVPVVPNAQYCFCLTSMTDCGRTILGYDANKNFVGIIYEANPNSHVNLFTPSVNVHFIRFQMYAAYGQTASLTYKNDICINISSDRNGEYEPYAKHSYPLDSTLTLRGIPKLDSNNQIYFDGDTYAADGTVTRKYGVRAYQEGDESLADAITDGMNTVYKLTTPTTETAEPFTNLQKVDPYGTEEYVTTSIVPAGHYTKYPENLRAKIENLDLSMIAPIETGTTASQAYAVGKYFLLNNKFCKAKTTIASGATFTLGTNYEVTTIADELYTALNA